MELFDNKINKKITLGFFPDKILYPIADYSPKKCNFGYLAKDGLDLLRNNSEVLYYFFRVFDIRVKEIESVYGLECFEKNMVNVMINTGYLVDDVNVLGKTFQESFEFCSAVTHIDKILWYGIWCYYTSTEMDLNYEYYERVMFALIYLLKNIQTKEMKYKLTIDVNNISAETDILRLLEGDWDKEDTKCFLKLSVNDIKRLESVYETTTRLSELILEDNQAQKESAEKTYSEWHLFLEILNDLANNEKDVIERILYTEGSKDKIKIINEYDEILRGVERGKYIINGTEVNLFSLFEAIYKRMIDAPIYCVVKTDCDSSFRIRPEALMLVMKPKTFNTFNYLFITFHEFRLAPGKDTAKKFVALALSTIRRNFGEKVIQYISLDEMIEAFYLTVVDFVEKNAKVIAKLSFEELQMDRAVLSAELLSSVDVNYFVDDMKKRIKEFRDSDEYEKEIRKIVSGTVSRHTAHEVDIVFKIEEERNNCIEQEALATRIVSSLNIIYLFCDALRIIISNPRTNIKIKKRENVEKYRKELLQIDDKIVHKVYAKLGEQKIGMLEYRESTGIDSIFLSEKEKAEDHYRNSLCADIMKETIEDLIVNLEKKNTEEIMRINSRVRDEIFRLPNCDEKERYAKWLDNICRNISDCLKANCIKEDDYQALKGKILNVLGENAYILPNSTIDSLTTAEMLYGNFVSEEYAKKGFDFSCISALYYQAFEDAYNALIWKDYAEKLNALEINGKKYTDILDEYKNKSIDSSDAKGYLDSNPKQRKYYVEYSNLNKSETKISTRCMYKSFAILLSNIGLHSKLEHFCEYFADITGFGSINEMFSNLGFMRELKSFRDVVDASTDNRNNASHGGTYISVDQCKNDRRIVIGELDVIESDGLGLIQQLLLLLNYD